MSVQELKFEGQNGVRQMKARTHALQQSDLILQRLSWKIEGTKAMRKG